MFKIEKQAERAWKVTNEENGNEYYVVFRGVKLECHCLGFIGHSHCQHVDAVVETLKK